MDIDKKFELHFPVSKVYDAWVSPETIIPPATDMRVNPIVGGAYSVIVQTPDATLRTIGKFLLVAPNKQVRYTWQWENDPEITEINVHFEHCAIGTKIHVQHTGFTSKTSLENHDKGWDAYVAGLIALLKKP